MRTKISDVDSQSHNPSINENESSPKLERTKAKSKTEKCLKPLNTKNFIQDDLNEANEKTINNSKALYSTPKHTDNHINNTDLNKRFYSLAWSYYNSSQKYLQSLVKKKEGMARANIDQYENSHNFIEKESYNAKNDNDNESIEKYLNTENELLINNDNEIEQFNQNITNRVVSQFSKSQINTSPFIAQNTMSQHNNIGRCNSYPYQQKPSLFNNNTQFHQYQIHQKKEMTMYPINQSQLPSQSINYQQNNSLIDQYTTEMFGRKGWICTICNNFNYESK